MKKARGYYYQKSKKFKKIKKRDLYGKSLRYAKSILEATEKIRGEKKEKLKNLKF